jgi:hypothetical protein
VTKSEIFPRGIEKVLARHDANRPRVEEALWIYAQMRRWGQIPPDTDLQKTVTSVFRPDVYATALDADAIS